jgi:hypothetical protein
MDNLKKLLHTIYLEVLPPTTIKRTFSSKLLGAGRRGMTFGCQRPPVLSTQPSCIPRRASQMGPTGSRLAAAVGGQLEEIALAARRLGGNLLDLEFLRLALDPAARAG